MSSAMDDLARRLYQRAGTVGLRAGLSSWESMPEADRDRWRAIAEVQSAEERFSADVWILTKAVQIMSAQLDKLEAAVRKNSDTIESAKTLIAGLAADLRASKDDPVKLEALANELDQKTASLAQAVVDNTPPTP